MKRRDPKAFQSSGPPRALLRSFSTVTLNHWRAVSPSPRIHPLTSPKAISLIRAPMMSGSWLVGLLNVSVTGDSVTLMPVGKLQRAINGGGVASRLLCVLMQAALILRRNKKAFVLVVKTFGAFFFLWPFLFPSPFPQRGTEGFWKSVAHYVPREPSEIRILNPYFIQEAAFQFIGLPFNNGLMGKGVRRTPAHAHSDGLNFQFADCLLM